VGPFKICEMVGTAAVRLEFPKSMERYTTRVAIEYLRTCDLPANIRPSLIAPTEAGNFTEQTMLQPGIWLALGDEDDDDGEGAGGAEQRRGAQEDHGSVPQGA
jgi:hypothetical protein